MDFWMNNERRTISVCLFYPVEDVFYWLEKKGRHSWHGARRLRHSVTNRLTGYRYIGYTEQLSNKYSVSTLSTSNLCYIIYFKHFFDYDE